MNKPDYLPNLFKKKNNIWYNCNQQSSYELCIYISSYKFKKTDDEWIKKIHQAIKSDTHKYGKYAGLNNWSHTFTDIQLKNFDNLIKNM